MKQELAVPHAARTRVVSRVKDSPRTDTANGTSTGLKARPKSTSSDSSSTKLAERSPQFNKRGLGAPRVDGESERLVRELQKEVTGLRTEIEKLRVRNVELESQNRKLEQDLDAAEAKIKRMEKVDQEKQNNPTEMEVKLGNRICKNQPLAMGPATQAVEFQPNAMIKMPVPTLTPSKRASHGPPPPPPPPPHNASGRATVNKASSVLVQLYHSLTKQEGKQGSTSNGGSPNTISSIVHSGIVGELQHRSAHLVAIKADVETKGQFIKQLIEKVQLSSFTSMEDVLTFVDWLDGELSTLVDERAVLKHFDWPEKRADALREAAVEYRDLKQLEAQVCSLKDDSSLPCEAALKKISNLLDKLERGVDRLLKLRNVNMMLYEECKIPTDWLLDCGMVNKMKQISVKLARLYLSRVSMELELFQPSERQSTQEALLFQGVKFAYRAHQFAGGLESEVMITIEELKKKVESQSRGSQQKQWKAGTILEVG